MKKNFFCIITFRQRYYLRLFLNNSPIIISRKNTRI